MKTRFAALNRVFAGRYDFLRLLGCGGFAEVFLAQDVLLEREVAIKILLPQHARDDQTVERFLREARLYAKLEHKNIIPVYDTGVLEQHVFITMKYIRGESLKHVLSSEGRVAPQLLPGIAAGVAAALGYIHQQGIVHRDIKPANILVEAATLTAYLADFGIARAESSQTLTQTGMIVGTPHYLSPEQIKGRKIDPRADIYSLGATLFELASGRPPFQGDSPMEILYQHINESPPSLAALAPGIDPAMARIIARCMEKDPARRFQRAGEIIDALERPGTPREPEGEKTQLTRPVPRFSARAATALAGTALLAAALVGAYFFWLRDSGPPRDPAANRKDVGKRAAVALDPHREAEPGTTANGDADGPKPAAVVRAGGGEERGAKGERPPEQPGEGTKPQPDKARAAAPPPGIVRFSSFPSLADVYLGGEKIGNTEQVFEKSLPPGDYVFNFSIPGFQSVAVNATVHAGRTTGAHHRFPQFRSFTITARPFGRIQIDGKDFGDTPQTVKLAFGEHLVRVTKEGYLPGERRVTIDQNARNSVYFELNKEEKQ